MKRAIGLAAIAVIVGVALGVARPRTDALASAAFPEPSLDNPLAAAFAQESVVVAGGCFWGVQAVFQHVKGVTSATSGYAGGSEKTARYEVVSSGTTGHAESVRVVYDASQISLGQILKIFFRVVHDPTELNRQGPDEGPQYRSAIFYDSDRQRQIADAYIAQLGEAKAFRRRIVTQVVPLDAFYAAEAYHQDYATRHPFDPYIMINDRPKVDSLRSLYPAIYIEPPRRR
jgi:peptide-methionine (S)-S-oxide reductase